MHVPYEYIHVHVLHAYNLWFYTYIRGLLETEELAHSVRLTKGTHKRGKRCSETYIKRIFSLTLEKF